MVSTSGSSGIGRTIALALAEAGANIVVLARGRQRLEECAHAIEATGDLQAIRDCQTRMTGLLAKLQEQYEVQIVTGPTLTNVNDFRAILVP